MQETGPPQSGLHDRTPQARRPEAKRAESQGRPRGIGQLYRRRRQLRKSQLRLPCPGQRDRGSTPQHVTSPRRQEDGQGEGNTRHRLHHVPHEWHEFVNKNKIIINKLVRPILKVADGRRLPVEGTARINCTTASGESADIRAISTSAIDEDMLIASRIWKR